MAIPNSISSLITIFFIVLLLLLSHNVANSLVFRYPNFDPSSNGGGAMTFQGDASASEGILQLTKTINGVPQPNSSGRASYPYAVQLWDSKTGKVAAFTTTFAFIVSPSSPSSGLFGDGFSFFFAPFFSDIPSDSGGGFLGLFSAPTALNSSENQIFAVEFDTFWNSWDPTSSAHIGVDINSIASVNTTSWSVVEGLLALATISYDPIVQELSVYVRYPERNEIGTFSNLRVSVDLGTILPDWVRVGFSGATGLLAESHKILSWSFMCSNFAYEISGFRT
ncbi:hypothetical protein K1719_003786 [Acacia pycnantha]|nr:hypothetical protein K1719_003786 [Acacia pycnantha]